MFHPIFKTLISQPNLVIDHFAGYASLVQEEAADVGNDVVKRAVAWGVAAVAALIFLILTGVAAIVGLYNAAFHWSLLVVPLVPLVVALIAFNAARQPLPKRAFSELRAQLAADAEMFRAGKAGS